MNFMFFGIQPTAMYIDISSVSIILTSVGGIAIAVSAVALIAWRKAKKKISNVLHIDENAGKEVEEELVINEETDGEENK